MAGRRIVTQWQIFVAHARLVDEMRAVRFGDGVERAGFDYGQQIDFGGEGAFCIDRAGRVSSDVHGSLLELETSRVGPSVAVITAKLGIRPAGSSPAAS